MMRDYAKVEPRFWVGETGRTLRAGGRDALLLAQYLMSSPHSNMLGLYYLPLEYIAHDLGMPLTTPSEGVEELRLTPSGGKPEPLPSPSEGASKGLPRPFEGVLGVREAMELVVASGFAKYDWDSGWVWVQNMALHQVGGDLKRTDNRIKGIRETLAALPKNPFTKEFQQYYEGQLVFSEPPPSEGKHEPLPSPSGGPSKGLRRASEPPSKPGSGTGTGLRLNDDDVSAAPQVNGRTPSEGVPDPSGRGPEGGVYANVPPSREDLSIEGEQLTVRLQAVLRECGVKGYRDFHRADAKAVVDWYLTAVAGATEAKRREIQEWTEHLVGWWLKERKGSGPPQLVDLFGPGRNGGAGPFAYYRDLFAKAGAPKRRRVKHARA